LGEVPPSPSLAIPGLGGSDTGLRGKFWVGGHSGDVAPPEGLICRRKDPSPPGL
jgi:hypothetical protein